MNVRLYVCVVCMYLCMNVASFVCKIYILGKARALDWELLFFTRKVGGTNVELPLCQENRGIMRLKVSYRVRLSANTSDRRGSPGPEVMLSDVESQKLPKVKWQLLTLRSWTQMKDKRCGRACKDFYCNARLQRLKAWSKTKQVGLPGRGWLWAEGWSVVST